MKKKFILHTLFVIIFFLFSIASHSQDFVEEYLGFAFNTNSQQLKNNEQKTPVDYLTKSIRQRTIGFIILGGGVVAFTGGAIAMEYSQSKGESEFPFIVAGLAMTLTSIPFFILSASNKHKAKIYMKKEALLLAPAIKTGIVYNSIQMKINF